MRYLFTFLLVLGGFKGISQTITTIAGTGLWACSGTGGAAMSAGVGQVYSVTTDTAGNVYVGASTCRKVLKIAPSGIISAYAGNGVGGGLGDGGPATAAQLGQPTSLATDRFGNLYISDNENSVIRKVNAAGIISTVAGDASVVGGGYSGDGGPASAALLQWPEGIATDAAGNLYVADNGNSIIRKISTAGIITRIAGDGSWTYSGDGGSALMAGIPCPRGLAVDRYGNLFVSDDVNHRVRKISTAGIITCVAGTGVIGYTGDGGAGNAATLRYPRGLSTDRVGNLFIADAGNNVIRMVDTGGMIVTFAGNGGPGHSGDGGPATMAQISHPYDVHVDRWGVKYIGELNGAYVRRTDTCLAPIVASVTGDTSLCAGDTVNLDCTTMGGVWSSTDTLVATVDTTGSVVAGTRGVSTISYTVTNSCASVSRSRTVIVGPYAGSIFVFGHTPSASGVDTFCYHVDLTCTGAPRGVWKLKDTTTATINAFGSVSPITFGVVDTAMYIVSDSCGADTAFFDFVIEWCIESVPGVAGESRPVKVWPNPCGEALYFAGVGEGALYRIEDMTGRTVKAGRAEQGTTALDVKELPAGLYVLQIAGYRPELFLKR